MYLQLLERGCVADAATMDKDGKVILSKVSDSLIRPYVDVEEIVNALESRCETELQVNIRSVSGGLALGV